MPSALAYQPGEYHAQGWELLTAVVCQRSKLSAKLDGERRSCSCAGLQQQTVDEAVKPQVIPQSTQLSRAGEEWWGQGKQEAFQNCVRTLRVPPALSLAAELGKHLPACLGGLGTPFAGRSPSAQPMVLTSPTEDWEGASAWLPTISPLPGSSSTKGCKSPLKNSWCVCVCALGTPRHLVTVARSQVAAPRCIWCQACACPTAVPKRGLVLAASLVSLLWESLAPSPAKEPL